jgi:hypothetical protein
MGSMATPVAPLLRNQSTSVGCKAPDAAYARAHNATWTCLDLSGFVVLFGEMGSSSGFVRWRCMMLRRRAAVGAVRHEAGRSFWLRAVVGAALRKLETARVKPFQFTAINSAMWRSDMAGNQPWREIHAIVCDDLRLHQKNRGLT